MTLAKEKKRSIVLTQIIKDMLFNIFIVVVVKSNGQFLELLYSLGFPEAFKSVNLAFLLITMLCGTLRQCPLLIFWTFPFSFL